MFNSTNIKDLRNKVEAALKAAGIDDIQFNVEGIRYEPGKATLQLIAKVDGVETHADKALAREAAVLGLQMENSAGDRLVGYKPRNHKYPFIYESGGKRWKCDAQAAKMRFGG